MKLDENGFMSLHLNGAEGERFLRVLMEEFGTKDVDVVVSVLMQIQRLALLPDGNMSATKFQILLGLVRDEKPKTPKERRIAVINAGLQLAAIQRVWENSGNTTFLDQDQAGQNGLRHCVNALKTMNDVLQPKPAPASVQNTFALQVNQTAEQSGSLGRPVDGAAVERLEQKPPLMFPQLPESDTPELVRQRPSVQTPARPSEDRMDIAQAHNAKNSSS
jgi:hypothetical protein